MDRGQGAFLYDRIRLVWRHGNSFVMLGVLESWSSAPANLTHARLPEVAIRKITPFVEKSM